MKVKTEAMFKCCVGQTFYIVYYHICKKHLYNVITINIASGRVRMVVGLLLLAFEDNWQPHITAIFNVKKELPVAMRLCRKLSHSESEATKMLSGSLPNYLPPESAKSLEQFRGFR